MDFAFDELDWGEDEGREGAGDGAGKEEGREREGIVALVEMEGEEGFAGQAFPKE